MSSFKKGAFGANNCLKHIRVAVNFLNERDFYFYVNFTRYIE